jgi:hypothetical protein
MGHAVQGVRRVQTCDVYQICNHCAGSRLAACTFAVVKVVPTASACTITAFIAPSTLAIKRLAGTKQGCTRNSIPVVGTFGNTQ